MKTRYPKNKKREDRPALKQAFGLAFAVGLCLTAAALAHAAHAVEFPGEADEWHGFTRYTFEVDGRDCFVVVPGEPAEGQPWVWRARFFGHRPEPDIELLKKGFHLAYMDVAGMYGAPKAVAHWDAFYAFLTGEHGLHPKPALEAMSRGGLIAHNWAAANPEKVACVYADAPVLDFKSWPGGKGEGEGSPEDWRQLMEAYGFASEEEALAYEGNPVDKLDVLAKAGIPMLHICGDKDETVPFEENTRLFLRQYWKQGGTGEFSIIGKPGVGHEHGLDDPAAIVHFILKHTLYAEGGFPPASEEELEPWRVTKFVEPGPVHKDGGVLFLERGYDMTGVNWEGPLLREDYEITLEFMRVEGSDFACGLTFPIGEDCCSLILGGWGGSTCGISCLDYMDAADNETTTSHEFQNGRWYAVKVWVAGPRIHAWIDGDELVNVDTTGHKVDVRWEVEASKPLGIATWRTCGALRNFRIRALTEQEADSANDPDPY